MEKNEVSFDYTRLMSGRYDLDDKKFYKIVKDIISDFNRKYANIIRERKTVEGMGIDVTDEDMDCYNLELSCLVEQYENKLLSVCSDSKKTCDYVIDIYYRYFKTKSKMFIWETFGNEVLDNLKSKATKVQYPVVDDDGIEYLGRYYSIKEVMLA